MNETSQSNKLFFYLDQIHLFLEQAKGYVKAVEKSTSPIFSLREVFDPYT